MKPLQLILIAASFGTACMTMNKNHDFSIEKTWQPHKHIDSIYYYKAGANIDDDTDGLQFLCDGALIVRQMSGWCNTKPVSYETVNGSWNKTSDSTIKLDYPYWNGRVVTYIQVLRISDTELVFKPVNPVKSL
ncbi:MAG: hypothetical protein QM791_20280 [Ferruginibacter sp.]